MFPAADVRHDDHTHPGGFLPLCSQPRADIAISLIWVSGDLYHRLKVYKVGCGLLENLTPAFVACFRLYISQVR